MIGFLFLVGVLGMAAINAWIIFAIAPYGLGLFLMLIIPMLIANVFVAYQWLDKVVFRQ